MANFLLAWWNAAECGGFDLTDAWSLDEAILADVKTTFGLATRLSEYPDTLGYAKEFARIIEQWRPDLNQRTRSGPS